MENWLVWWGQEQELYLEHFSRQNVKEDSGGAQSKRDVFLDTEETEDEKEGLINLLALFILVYYQ